MLCARRFHIYNPKTLLNTTLLNMHHHLDCEMSLPMKVKLYYQKEPTVPLQLLLTERLQNSVSSVNPKEWSLYIIQALWQSTISNPLQRFRVQTNQARSKVPNEVQQKVSFSKKFQTFYFEGITYSSLSDKRKKMQMYLSPLPSQG